jgi:predicted permease
MRSILKDLRYAVRGLMKNPGFAFLSVATLGLGIGAATVSFSLVNGVLIRPLPFEDPGRLVTLRERFDDGRVLTLSFPNFDDYRTQAGALEGITAIRFAAEMTVLGGEDPARGVALPVSREFFEVLGVHPFLGRPILPSENREGGEAVTVLSYEFWARNYGGNPELNALRVDISGRSYTVVGVMPPGFKLFETADLYLPLELNPFRVRDSHNYRAVGRLAPGATLTQARAELAGIVTRIREAYPGETRTVAVDMEPLRAELLGPVNRPLFILLGAAGLLLLLACGNVASTLLARGTRREREMAIRTAVGAARSRLLQLLFTEGLILAGLAGTLGVGLSSLTLSLVRGRGVDLLPRLQTVSMDGRVLLFAVVASLLTSIVFGLLPALRVPEDAAGTLRTGRSAGHRKRGVLGWNLLVGSQAALAIVLVVASGLLIRSLREILSEDTHFRPEGVLTVAMDFRANQYATAEERTGDLEELKREFQSLPGVTGVGFVNHLPTEGLMMTGPVIPSPIPENLSHDNAPLSSGFRVVDEDYFTAMGIPLMRGRFFSEEDGPETTPVVILNQALADLTFPGEDPVGKQVQFLPFWREMDLTVVGVVAEARDWRSEPGSQRAGYVFWPQRPSYTQYLIAVIHTTADPASLVGAVRERLKAVSPNTPGTIYTLESLVAQSLRERSFTLGVLGVFAALSLLLAGVGIYGVVSYSVSQRTREIGIQLALGATPGLLRRQEFASAFRTVVLGAALGLGGAAAAAGMLESLLYEVGPRDPLAFLAAPLVVLPASILAILVPVLRNTRVDPALTMRQE